MFRPLKLNCNLALILRELGFGRCPTINLRWLAVVAVVAKAPLGSAAVRSTEAKNKNARIVRVSGGFRCDWLDSLICRLGTDGIDCMKGIREGIAVKRKTIMPSPTK